MSGPTKGTWRAERNGDQWQVISTTELGGEIAVATIERSRVGFSSPMDAADAKLMAASKELLAALEIAQAFVVAYVELYRLDHKLPESHPVHAKSLAQIEAAIAKTKAVSP